MRKFKPTSLQTILSTSVGLFLITGLSGCADSKCSKSTNQLSRQDIEDCKDFKSIPTSQSSSTHSGFFMPVHTSTSTESFGG